MGILAINNIKILYYERKYTIKEIAGELGVSFWSIYNFMDKYSLTRRDRSEASFLSNRIKPQFKIKSDLSISDEKLRIAGIMLYWAEGTFQGNTVDFVNSNPRMIRLFMKFLRRICTICEERIRIYLYAYPYQNLEEAKKYWHNITEVPLSQFTKPYIRKGNLNLTNRRLPFGLIHIRYNDKRLLETLRIWINEYLNNDGQVPKWPKGADCLEGSVLSKGKMEK